MAVEVTQPILAADQILTFAQSDAVRAYGDLSDYSVRLSLEDDGWHVDYDLRNPRTKRVVLTMCLIRRQARF